jgi:hypothetical protein
MEYFDVVLIMFSCVMSIHMGLIDAFIEAYNTKNTDVPIITCPKCLTFWCVLAYMIISKGDVVHSIATSFLASYTAIWLDLLLGKLDGIYEKIFADIRKDERPDDTPVLYEEGRDNEGEDDALPKV